MEHRTHQFIDCLEESAIMKKHYKGSVRHQWFFSKYDSYTWKKTREITFTNKGINQHISLFYF